MFEARGPDSACSSVSQQLEIWLLPDSAKQYLSGLGEGGSFVEPCILHT
jgi:hypothetical protein